MKGPRKKAFWVSSVHLSGEDDGQVQYTQCRRVCSKTKRWRREDRRRLCTALSWQAAPIAGELFHHTLPSKPLAFPTSIQVGATTAPPPALTCPIPQVKGPGNQEGEAVLTATVNPGAVSRA